MISSKYIFCFCCLNCLTSGGRICTMCSTYRELLRGDACVHYSFVHGLQGIKVWCSNENHVRHELCCFQHLQSLRRDTAGHSWTHMSNLWSCLKLRLFLNPLLPAGWHPGCRCVLWPPPRGWTRSWCRTGCRRTRRVPETCQPSRPPPSPSLRWSGRSCHPARRHGAAAKCLQKEKTKPLLKCLISLPPLCIRVTQNWKIQIKASMTNMV